MSSDSEAKEEGHTKTETSKETSTGTAAIYDTQTGLAQPGLGIDNFSPVELQEQLDSVRRFSAAPLQLGPSQLTPSQAAVPLNNNRESPNESEAGQNQTTTERPAVAQTDTKNTENMAVASPIPQSAETEAVSESVLDSGSIAPLPDSGAAFVPRNLRSGPGANPPGSSGTVSSSRLPKPVVRPIVKRDLLRPAPTTESRKRKRSRVAEAKTVRTPPPSSAVPQLSVPQRGTPSKQTNISKTISLGDPFRLLLHGLIWTYIPGLSEAPRGPEFERELGNLETSFVFRFPTVGHYFLTFSRQLPSTGELEYYNAEIIVEDDQASATSPDNGLQSGAMMATPIPNSGLPLIPADREVKLMNAGTKNISELDSEINYRITGQVISDIRKLLKDGEMESAYQTLNNWPSRERGDIYDTAAQYFLNAGMNTEAVDMWQRNVGLAGELQSKAVVGIVEALTRNDDANRLLEWLPQFLQQASSGQNSPDQTPLIHTEDFAKVYRTLSKLNEDSPQSTIVSSESKYAEYVLKFYQTYVDFYADSNSPEILHKMGLFFEEPGKNQDLRRARQLYKSIRTNYPVDEYSQKASDRLHYLDRQFFLVR
ncbi:hypothetical protein P0082_02220 [Candidatus Haliotispira prima]|uniref:Outer membrane lipoprotein BamD-like domain-containing protein n=1 Tax=Candidatus Haliotispira prima TaxID=3034016 RepID=A0ABY8MLM3_9SPIO|nr:hypothetical protein P0082_02220 [Candidatus Haliotispira prima]